MDTTTPVQPIIVHPVAPVNILIRDVARASVLALELIDSHSWEEWKSRRYTKSVRKVKPMHLELWSEEFGWVTQGYAAAGSPMPYPEYPSKVAKARVEGWGDVVLPWEDAEEDVDMSIMLNSDLGMSPGKSCAQAAHALMKWHLAEQVSIQDLKIDVQMLSFSSLDSLPSGVVIDSGLTEIAPNSPTAFVRTTPSR